MRVRTLLLVLGICVSATTLSAQTPFNLRDILTDFLREGITLAPPPSGFPTHQAHFVAEDSPEFVALQQFSTSVAAQLSTFPLASPAGGFTYNYDPTLGVVTRASESFGPIYAERATTIGKGKFNIGLNYTHFEFDRFDGLNLRNGDLKLVFTHQDTNGDNSTLTPFFEGDLITGNLQLKVRDDITAFVMTVGATDRLDLSAAIPFVNVSIASQASMQVQRISTGQNSTVHTFKNGTTSEIIQQSGSASGVGDIVLRAKYRFPWQLKNAGFAFATDVRLPTGQQEDLLGAGITQVKPYIIATYRIGSFAPHINAGYGWNATKSHPEVPDELSYTAGFDWAVNPRMTLAADLIGRSFRDTNIASVQQTTYQANTNGDPKGPPTIVTAVFPTLVSHKGTSSTTTGAIGVKVNPAGNMLITINGLFGLGDRGLQSRFSPLLAFEYSF